MGAHINDIGLAACSFTILYLSLLQTTTTILKEVKGLKSVRYNQSKN